jgi:hypothetical protein
MQDHHMDEEIYFWQCLIEWWETHHNEPAPMRMQEALRLARSKFPQLETNASAPAKRLH